MSQPLAIGLIKVGPCLDRVARRRWRNAITRFAKQEGYALLETFDIEGDVVRDSSVVTVLIHLANRAGASALLISGDVPDRPAQAIVSSTVMIPIKVCSPTGPRPQATSRPMV